MRPDGDSRLSWLILVVMLGACSARQPVHRADVEDNDSTTQQQTKTISRHAVIRPLPPVIGLAHLDNAEFPASFNTDNFDWNQGSLRLNVFSEDRYDSITVSKMRVGDTLIFDEDTVLVESVEEDSRDGWLTINHAEEDGPWLAPVGNGLYRGSRMDDYHTFTLLGSVELPLAEDWVYIPYLFRGYEMYDSVVHQPRAYLDSLNEWERQFGPMDNLVQTRGGKIVSIKRRYTP